MLATTALAAGREVVVSRGEMVEIGDGFRLPDLIASAGARLREVGTTNRTTLADYEAAIGPDTGCILKVHPSNFRVEGFTSAVPVAALAALGQPVVHDIGSGLLRPHPLLPDEPDAARVARRRCRRGHLQRRQAARRTAGRAGARPGRHRHPAAPAPAGPGGPGRQDRPSPRSRPPCAVRAPRSGTPSRPTPTVLRGALRGARRRPARGTRRHVVPADGVVGGGGAPGRTLPGWAVALPEPYAAALRLLDRPVLARVERGRCLVDLRCIPADADPSVAQAIRDAGQ